MDAINTIKIGALILALVLVMFGKYKASISLFFLMLSLAGIQLGLPEGVTLEEIFARRLTDDELIKSFFGMMFIPGAFVLMCLFIAPDVMRIVSRAERLHHKRGREHGHHD